MNKRKKKYKKKKEEYKVPSIFDKEIYSVSRFIKKPKDKPMNKEDYKLAILKVLLNLLDDAKFKRINNLFNLYISPFILEIHKLVSALVWLVFFIQFYMVIIIIRMLLGG